MKRIKFWNTVLGIEEADAAKNAILNKNISQGPITEQLENKLAKSLNVPYVTMTTSGSSALVMALLACGIKPSDEVIIPNRTYIATAHAVQLIGANVRLVDTLPDIPIIDTDKIIKTITAKTKAIIPVHINGRSCDMEKIKEIANNYNLCVIEDTAQALFSKNYNKFLGTMGSIGCFSLGVLKFMTSGQGGFVVTKSEQLHNKLKKIRSHGVSSPLVDTFDHFGFNFKYNDILAAIALIQLKNANKKKKQYIKLYKKYHDHLESLNSIKIIKVNVERGEIPIYIEAYCKERDKLLPYLANNGIDARNATPNLNNSSHLKQNTEFPNSSNFESYSFILPSGPNQIQSDIDFTLNTLNTFDNQ